MRFLSPIEKSISTLCSSSSVMDTLGPEGENGRTSMSSEGGTFDDEDDEYELSDCDVTLVDDANLRVSNCNPENEGELMFLQVVEMLRFEQEVNPQSSTIIALNGKILLTFQHHFNLKMDYFLVNQKPR